MAEPLSVILDRSIVARSRQDVVTRVAPMLVQVRLFLTEFSRLYRPSRDGQGEDQGKDKAGGQGWRERKEREGGASGRGPRPAQGNRLGG